MKKATTRKKKINGAVASGSKISQELNKGQKSSSSFFAIVIGASAGGINAINELISHLPPKLNAAIFIVLHMSRTALSELLVDRIKKITSLKCKLARENERIKPGYIYIAVPDAHLLVKDDYIRLGHGPVENRFRPSIDVLFRSAAAHYGERAIGIILTGFLNDGTAGMVAIKQSGGHCIVQNPNEAEVPDMPLSVLETMEVDDSLPLKDIGKAILQITKNTELKGILPPDKVISESRLSEITATDIADVKELGENTVFACPDCGGGLWKVINGKVGHYRCHIGHSYSEKDLDLRQFEKLEQTIWMAVRMMEERKVLFSKFGKEYGEKGLKMLSDSYHENALQMESHIESLKKLLVILDRQDARLAS